MLGVIATVAVVLAGAVVYFDRASLKTKLVAAEAAVVSRIEGIENAVRAGLRGDVAKILADIRKWDAEAKEGSASVLAQVEARLKQII